ncbi:MAG: hypothetical protein ACE5MI_05300 [Acidimicrobiia bacterium]
MNYYEGFARIRERDIETAVSAAELADDYLRPNRFVLRTRVGTGLVGLGLFVLGHGRISEQLGRAA